MRKSEAKTAIFPIHSAIAKCLQSKENEKGLFSLVFHPEFAGYLYPVCWNLTSGMLRLKFQHAACEVPARRLPVIGLHIMYKQGLNRA